MQSRLSLRCGTQNHINSGSGRLARRDERAGTCVYADVPRDLVLESVEGSAVRAEVLVEEAVEVRSREQALEQGRSQAGRRCSLCCSCCHPPAVYSGIQNSESVERVSSSSSDLALARECVVASMELPSLFAGVQQPLANPRIDLHARQLSSADRKSVDHLVRVAERGPAAHFLHSVLDQSYRQTIHSWSRTRTGTRTDDDDDDTLELKERGYVHQPRAKRSHSIASAEGDDEGDGDGDDQETTEQEEATTTSRSRRDKAQRTRRRVKNLKQSLRIPEINLERPDLPPGPFPRVPSAPRKSNLTHPPAWRAPCPDFPPSVRHHNPKFLLPPSLVVEGGKQQ